MKRQFIFNMIQQTCAALPRLNFSLSALEIREQTAELLRKSRTALDSIAKIPPNEYSFPSVIKALALLESEFTTEIAKLNFPQYVSPNKEVRDACVEATKLIDQFQIEKSMRVDLFIAVKAVSDKLPSNLHPESKRLVEKMMLEFELNGLGLDDSKRAQLKKHREKLADLEVQYSNNMNEDSSKVEFTKDELAGCPEDFFSSLQVNESTGKYILTMKYPDVFGVLRNAENENTRKRMEIAFSTRSPQNLPLIQEAIKLRQECALLLGYKEHTQVRLLNKMAKKPENVLNFLSDLQSKLAPLGSAQLKKLQEMKSKDSSSPFMSFDFGFYNRKLVQKEYSVDHEKIKEYFPLEHVIREMLTIYETVLGIRFNIVEGGPTWHSDAKLYEVSSKESGKAIGYIFFDLHPRDGKYTHAACFQLQPGYELADGHRQLPACALVCNFTKPSGDRPSLLNHDEVVTLFHELGHGMHDMCGKVLYGRFHGTNVEYDFVEAPSQMLENWCWEPEILKKLSKHYKANEALPDELIAALVKSKNVNSGLVYLRQLFFSKFDMYIHSAEYQSSSEPVDKVYQRMRGEISLISQPDESNPIASFGHMMGGYDAGYYGYLYSQVFSADMFVSRFRKEGLLNEACGRDYREKILQPSGSRSGSECLISFLGREPTNEAFLESIGLSTAN
jgi:thimet oligopeptidase